MKVILDFQLQEHEKFLSSFTSLFKEVDIDSNGIISEDEFKELIHRMNVVPDLEDQIDLLLNTIDPHNNKQMTYSEVVQLLSTQMIPISEDNPRMVPLLEKFVNQVQIMKGLGNNTSGSNTNQRLFNEESEQQLQQKYYEFFGA